MNSASDRSNLLAQFGAAEVLDALADGAYVTDIERRIVFWNHAAERILGWNRADVIGRTCSDGLLAHEDKDGHRLCGCEHCPLHRSMVTGTSSGGSLLVFAQSRQGQRVPVEVSVAPVRDAAGDVVGGIELFRDMTQGMRDLWRAKRIQDSALECPLPEDSRLEFERCYQPHEVVGGDFCRVERCGDDAYVLLMADVMGHGVASALYTMQLRSLWEDHRNELVSPARFLGVLNARLNALVSDAGYFASAIAVRYDAVTGNLRYVRAGHPAPLIIRADGVTSCPGESQPALGLLPDLTYTEVQAHLDPGEALLLFTDGAVEVANADGQDLEVAGLARLIQDLTAGRGANSLRLAQLEEALVRFCGQVHLPDDLAMLKLRRCPIRP
jgi:PAS domain S-box-containing protein